ncbi:MAG TPA: hypothetical protein VE083_07740 [Terriglobales bacterium]|nr:hypothetical protein [Terriglobales bacterium]
MRKSWGAIGVMLLLAVAAMAAPKATPGTQSNQPFPGTLRNARYVYVASYDGDEFNIHLLPEDRDAIVAVQDAIRKWGKLTLVYRPEEADIVLLVESRPSEDILAVYDARQFSNGMYLWRVMGRDGLEAGETPLFSQFEKGFEGVQPTSDKSTHK